MLINPPYGERMEAAGFAGAQAADPQRRGAARRPADDRSSAMAGRELAQTDDGGGDFFVQLAAHWKKNYAGWTAWMLSPDLKLPGKMRLKESRRVPMWNGPIECRLFRFDIVKGSARADTATKPVG